MYAPEQLRIDLHGLRAGETRLVFDLGDDFFEAVGGDAVQRGHVCADVRIQAASGYFELDFHIAGTVQVPCDVCLDDVDVPIDTERHLTAKFAEEDNTDDDDLITVDESTGILDTEWLIYEFVALSIPVRHVHAPGKCNPAMMEVLQQHTAARSSDGNDSSDTPSPWDALATLTDKQNN